MSSPIQEPNKQEGAPKPSLCVFPTLSAFCCCAAVSHNSQALVPGSPRLLQESRDSCTCLSGWHREGRKRTGPWKCLVWESTKLTYPFRVIAAVNLACALLSQAIPDALCMPDPYSLPKLLLWLCAIPHYPGRLVSSHNLALWNDPNLLFGNQPPG